MKYCAFDDSGWYRVDIGNAVLFLHINSHGGPDLSSHAHNDTLSFVLFLRGQQVIIDPGRFNYNKDLLGIYGKKARAHNSIILDDYDPFPLNRYMYSPKYRNVNVFVDYEIRQKIFYLKISHEGFKRLNKKFYSYREVCLSDKYLQINDYIDGDGIHNVKTFFHLSDNIRNLCQKARTGVKFDIDGHPVKIDLISNFDKNYKIQIASGLIEPEPIGWFFPEYGKAIATHSCIFEVDVQLPYQAQYMIGFD